MYVKSQMNMLKSACLSGNCCLYLHLCFLTVLQHMICEKIISYVREPPINDSHFTGCI